MSRLSAGPAAPGKMRSKDIKNHHWVECLKDGTRILIRPLEAGDREREFAFIKDLSPQSRRFRFMATLNEPGAPLLERLMNIDYHKRMAYVALNMDHEALTEIGVARYADLGCDEQCEAAVVVADRWQNMGLGKCLMVHLIEAARLNGFQEMLSMDSAVNTRMHHLANTLGFECRRDPLDATQVIYRLPLQAGQATPGPGGAR